jgi:hypothetical protein
MQNSGGLKELFFYKDLMSSFAESNPNEKIDVKCTRSKISRQ